MSTRGKNCGDGGPNRDRVVRSGGGGGWRGSVRGAGGGRGGGGGGGGAGAQEPRYIGVRKREWGGSPRYCAEIRHRKKNRKLWLGSFDTAEEAALAYDAKARQLRGPNATTNFSAAHQTPIAAASGANIKNNIPATRRSSRVAALRSNSARDFDAASTNIPTGRRSLCIAVGESNIAADGVPSGFDLFSNIPTGRRGRPAGRSGTTVQTSSANPLLILCAARSGSGSGSSVVSTVESYGVEHCHQHSPPPSKKVFFAFDLNLSPPPEMD